MRFWFDTRRRDWVESLTRDAYTTQGALTGGWPKMIIEFGRSTLVGSLLALIGTLAGCGSPSPTAPAAIGPTPTDVTLSIVSGNAQSAAVNTQLPNDIRVQVLSAGKPVADFAVDFVVTSGGGSVFGGAEVTNSSGYADELWTLGPRLGPQTLAARSVNPTTGVAQTYGTFTATGLPPHTIPVVITNTTGIAIMNADGSGLKQLTTAGNAVDYFPALSADRSSIVFTSNRTGSPQIWRMKADGTAQTRLTFDNSFDYVPQWSPYGTLIVFISERSGVGATAREVYVMNADGSNQTRITFGGSAGTPSWAPDGDRIAFTIGVNGSPSDIYLINADGSDLTRLTYESNAGGPSWSPDGQHIVFQVAFTSSWTDLYVVDPEGNGITRLTTSGKFGATPGSWSPDSQLIGTDLGLMNADGTGMVNMVGGEGAFPRR
jgi:tricorn protease-like protein